MTGFEFFCWLAITVCSVIVLVGIVRGTLKWSARQVMNEVKKSSHKNEGEEK
jgi:heme exporter protein D